VNVNGDVLRELNSVEYEWSGGEESNAIYVAQVSVCFNLPPTS
jgi:hypothetical protein